MTIEYRREVAALDTLIEQQQYYTNRWFSVLAHHKVTREEIHQLVHDQSFLVEVLNDFWFALPDSPAIRTEPFFLLCDLCIVDQD